MKLQSRFLQLPLSFDAGILAQEVASLGPAPWRPHPAGYEGNDFLPLVAVGGDPGNEGFTGPMLPTPQLRAMSYMWEVLDALGAVVGRTRLMRLQGHAEVSEHADVNYYWRDRMRVHVPIVTQPEVRFYCADMEAHMAPGECWVFDTWSLHRVKNAQDQARIHLVVDTVGGDGMLRLLHAGRQPGAPATGWSARTVVPMARHPQLEFERVNVPCVMSPWELREQLSFLLGEVASNQPVAAQVTRLAGPFLHRWRALWAAHGESESGWGMYRGLLDQFARDLTAVGADQLLLVNEVDFLESLQGLVLGVAAPAQRSHHGTKTSPHGAPIQV